MMASLLTKAKQFLLNLLLVLCSSSLPLLGAEMVLRFIQPPAPEKKQPQVKYVYMPCDTVAGRLSDYIYPEPNQTAYNLNVPVFINSRGLRNKEIDPNTSLSRHRILAVGDSHTFGYGIVEENSWPRQLERMLNVSPTNEDGTYEIINAGVPALSLSQEVEFFRERLSSLHPNFLILAYYWNDMPIIGLPEDPLADGESLERSISCSILKNSAYQNSSVQRNDFLLEMKQRATSLFRKSCLLYFVVQRLPFLQIMFFPTTETKWKEAILEGKKFDRIDASWKTTENELKELKELTLQSGVKLIVVCIPFFEQMTTSGFPNRSYQQQLSQICDQNAIPFIDPLAAIRAIKPSYPKDFVPFDGHPTGRIYEAIAREICHFLKQYSRL